MNSSSGKTYLITGGTGSFGRAFLDRILSDDFREIRIFSRDELKQELMRNELRDRRIKFYLGDIRDRKSLDEAMIGVDYVFHAAALKQVPSCEFFPMQGVLTNIIGSQNVLESAVSHGVRNVVCLSTDKAVMPINAMGMTKALMEKCAQAIARTLTSSQTVISSVRYGNVMASRGSVIPLFIKQIQSGQPLTITVPEMTRFMLPLPQAIDLVNFALANSRQGDIFIRKAPACTVDVLVAALKQLLKASNPTEIIGMRHGEKIFETLATAEELQKADDLGDYMRISMDGRDLNYAKYYTEGANSEASVSDYTSHNTTRMNIQQVIDLLRTLPEIQQALK